VNSVRLSVVFAVALSLLAGEASLQAQAVGISSITTTVSYGSGETSQNLNGSTTDFSNASVAVNTVTDMNGNQYSVTGMATSAIVRTDSTATGEVNQSSVWYMGNTQTTNCDSSSDPTLLYGSYTSSTQASLLLNNNLLEGSDNLFVNSSSVAAAQDNIERVDFLYNGTTGIVDNNSLAIGVFDRGTGDAFSVAIITGVDSHGNPTSYGGFVTVTPEAFSGDDDLLTVANSNSVLFNASNSEPTDYLVRYDSSTSLATGNVTDDTQTVDQNISGVIMTLASLGIASGTKIYGYSLMGGDVEPGTNLNSLTNTSNTTVYPTTTSDTTAYDGLDAAAVNGVMFSLKPVPEPSTYAEVLLAGALGLYGWRRVRSPRGKAAS